MPKLSSDAAKKAKAAAQSSGFTPLEPGPYRARLVSVTAKAAASSGNPMWVWEFEVTDEGAAGRKLWVNTVLTENAMWKVAEMFAAFGRDEETDTDEIIGDECILEVVQRTITGGARAGEIGNDVRRAKPLEGAVAAAGAPAPAGGSGGGDAAGANPW